MGLNNTGVDVNYFTLNISDKTHSLSQKLDKDFVSRLDLLTVIIQNAVQTNNADFFILAVSLSEFIF